MWKNAYKWALKTQKLPVPLSGPWTPAKDSSLHSCHSTLLYCQFSASEAGAPFDQLLDPHLDLASSLDSKGFRPPASPIRQTSNSKSFKPCSHWMQALVLIIVVRVQLPLWFCLHITISVILFTCHFSLCNQSVMLSCNQGFIAWYIFNILNIVITITFNVNLNQKKENNCQLLFTNVNKLLPSRWTILHNKLIGKISERNMTYWTVPEQLLLLLPIRWQFKKIVLMKNLSVEILKECNDWFSSLLVSFTKSQNEPVRSWMVNCCHYRSLLSPL